MLRELYKSYKHKFILWSHQPLNFDDQLSGIPDYILAKQSPLGKFVFDKPYFIIVEAKRDNFSEGWRQCLAEMVAVQKINVSLEQPVFGVVSNGKTWEFGCLAAVLFSKNIKAYSIQNLDQLFAVLKSLTPVCDWLETRPRNWLLKSAEPFGFGGSLKSGDPPTRPHSPPTQLFAALNYVFIQCELIVVSE